MRRPNRKSGVSWRNGAPRLLRRPAMRARLISWRNARRCFAAKPRAVSSIMGVFSSEFVAALKARGIAWLATATTLSEAIRAQEAGADAIVAQGIEAGGHRGA